MTAFYVDAFGTLPDALADLSVLETAPTLTRDDATIDTRAAIVVPGGALRWEAQPAAGSVWAAPYVVLARLGVDLRAGDILSDGERAAVFDLQGATKQLAGGVACPDTAVAYWYVEGLIAASEAYRFGGSPESLEPVKRAIAELESRAGQVPAAEIAKVVLQAASSASQSEREEMGLLLEYAIDLEAKARAAGQNSAPIVSAYEVAGDLWLQVHRFEDARRAYLAAAEQAGSTRRGTLGMARTLSRLADLPAACEQYRTLVSGWPKTAGEPPELSEAHTFLRRPECHVAPAPRR